MLVETRPADGGSDLTIEVIDEFAAGGSGACTCLTIADYARPAPGGAFSR